MFGRVVAIGCIATTIALASGCGSWQRSSTEAESFSGGEHRAPTDMSSLRAAYIESVQGHASEAFLVTTTRGAFVARNQTQGLVSRFGEAGVQVESEKQAFRFSLSTERYGCAGDLRPLTKGEPRVEAQRVKYARAQQDGARIVEWYVNGPMGLEQGFTLSEAPACKSGRDAELSIDVAFDGDLEPTLSNHDIVLRDASGKEVARYGELFVRDAQSRILPSHFEVAGHKVRIAFDATSARYPLTVDPLVATERGKLFANEGRAFDIYGQSVAVSGNTAVVGAPGENGGAVHVFGRSGNTWVAQLELRGPNGLSGEFGSSVALSGSTLAVGAPGEGETGRGAVFIYVQSGAGWTRQTTLVGDGTTSGARFGFSVALSGNSLIVGAPLDDQSAESGGSAFIFGRTGTTWTQQAKLLGDTPFENTGASVAISGSTALVGCPSLAPVGVPARASSARVFVRLPGGTWADQQRLMASDSERGDLFGLSVAVSGDLVLVGAPFKQAGAAYAFARTGTTWAEERKLVPGDLSADSWFGRSVALSGNTAIIGAPNQTAEGVTDSGVAYAFDRDGGLWTQFGKLIPADTGFEDHAGTSVAVDGDVAFVGAPDSDLQGLDSGAAYAFFQTTTGPNSWTRQQRVVPEGGSIDGRFGEAIAVSGDTAVIGAPLNSERGEFAGAAYVFTRTGSAWTKQADLLASDGAPFDGFGTSVALSGNLVLIGAPGDADFGPGSGAAYVFARSGNNWTERVKLRASDGKQEDLFGLSVALSGNTAIVGAPDASAPLLSSGAAYVFVIGQTTATEQAKLLPDDATSLRLFGESVSVSGETALIGAPGLGSGNDPGAAYAFVRSGTAWTQQQKLVPGDPTPRQRFGAAVSLSQDTAAIGSPDDDDRGQLSGSVYMFLRAGATWAPEGKVTASDGKALDQFGAAVAVDGNTLAVGTTPFQPIDNRAFVFTRANATWSEQLRLFPSGVRQVDYSAAVAISGNRLMIGAPADPDQGRDSGAVYTYDLSETP